MISIKQAMQESENLLLFMQYKAWLKNLSLPASRLRLKLVKKGAAGRAKY